MVKRYHVDWDSVGLGERNDCEIAAEIGCTRFAVLMQRRKRGICSCSHRRVLRDLDAQIVKNLAAMDAEKLATVADEEQKNVDESSSQM